MGRIFSVQGAKLHEFRRKHRRKLRKGDVIRVHNPNSIYQVREELDLRPQTKDILSTKKYGNVVTPQGGVLVTAEIGKKSVVHNPSNSSLGNL